MTEDKRSRRTEAAVHLSRDTLSLRCPGGSRNPDVHGGGASGALEGSRGPGSWQESALIPGREEREKWALQGGHREAGGGTGKDSLELCQPLQEGK